RIARETLDIYAPIANRLGMNRLRLELEDLGFEAYYPVRSRILRAAVQRARGNRREILSKIEAAIVHGMAQEDLQGRVLCREKHLFGIYRKMRQKDLPFDEVFDVYAVRLIVDKVDTCYRALGIMHNIYKPVPGKFKDYIAIPKANGYQSLHSILFGPHGVAMEVQIRTEEMDRVAENGIAAHWLYKAGGKDADNSAQVRARRWLKELLEMQQSAGNSQEFLENVKVDLFPDEVYVFTPQGNILALPRGATPVDFAYAVHSDIGRTCVAAKVDRRLAPLSAELHNGQTVEIITAPSSRPNPAWLNFVVTGKARGAIRHYLKQLRRDEAISLGRRLLDKELTDYGLSVEEITEDRIVGLLSDFHLRHVEDLLEAVGLGNRTAGLVGRAIAQVLRKSDEANGGETEHQDQPLAIRGTEGAVVSFAKCCHPLPGDKIVGYVSAGKGLVVHTQDCRNVRVTRGNQPNWIDLDWAEQVEGDFFVPVRMEVNNQRGVLATIATVIAELDSNINHVGMDEKDGKSSTLDFVISVRDRVHLASIIKTLRRKGFIMKIHRTSS
ncbi:MAG: RelA/SpoT family protein, partial [Gammaproteobacteria bacterium]